MAPSWISTSKVRPALSKPRKCAASSRWPVELTGRYSVSPSTTPNTTAWVVVNNFCSAGGGLFSDAPWAMAAKMQDDSSNKAAMIDLGDRFPGGMISPSVQKVLFLQIKRSSKYKIVKLTRTFAQVYFLVNFRIRFERMAGRKTASPGSHRGEHRWL